MTGPTFQLPSLTAFACTTVDHTTVTGDDRSAIALSATNVFYSGDTATGRFAAADFSAPAALGRVYDTMFSDLATELTYTFATSAGPAVAGTNADRLLPIDPVTGQLGTTPVMLNSAIPMVTGTGIFAGAGRVVVAANNRLYHVSLPSGAVSDLGMFATPSRTTCDTGMSFGVAEFFGSTLYITYVRAAQVLRQAAYPAGATVALATMTNLADMCAFTVSPTRNRWYFHHENASQLGGQSPGETIGHCALTLPANTQAFPTATSSLGGPGGTRSLSTEISSGLRRQQSGDFVEQTLNFASTFSRLDLDLSMNNQTAGCAATQTLVWSVAIDGVQVGTYSFTGGPPAVRRISASFTFAPIAAGAHTIRITSTTTVCAGGGSWLWNYDGYISAT